ncbi:hypothetical protein RRG08_012855 [Elysia crispata]|uniref:Uncharacterized protein n=1 Tax=Elysia crispata TaxID=231223 RepID=A0AAE1ASZ7_9GAST|nr:hypothetical protein RRG08_061670 [Elysia crispata]KAK3792177.1 hypothetical protein RRG08_012855 [Elysia crispata]
MKSIILKEWHQILRHSNCVDGMTILDSDDIFECEVCTLEKMIQSRNRVPDAHAKKAFEPVHLDLAGPDNPVSVGGYRYALICNDDCFRFQIFDKDLIRIIHCDN